MSLLGGRETKPGKLSVHNVHVFIMDMRPSNENVSYLLDIFRATTT